MRLQIKDRIENNEPIYKEIKAQKLNINFFSEQE